MAGAGEPVSEAEKAETAMDVICAQQKSASKYSECALALCAGGVLSGKLNPLLPRLIRRG